VSSGANLIEELDSAGNVLARYTQTTAVDEPLAMLRSGTMSYFESDALGSSTSLSTGAGGLANTYIYDSFGKLTSSTGTLTDPFQYTGREFDLETGIYEYRARYYDQNAGRFLSEDPLHFRATIDFYPYTLNNPMLWRDPDGRGIGWGPIYSWFNNGLTYLKLIDCAVKTESCLSRLKFTVASNPLGGSPDDPNPTSDPEVNNIHSTCRSDKDCKKLFCECFFTFWSSTAMIPISPPSWLPFDPGGCKK
jgi:RHS repeat-associated protein